MTAPKVLYIGHYKEKSGWGQAARDYILSLDSVGIDVVPRALKLGNPSATLPARLLELEKKNAEGCNISLQHVLPHYMKYDSSFQKNIGLFELETSGIKYTSWPGHLNLMDEIWVPCNSMIKDGFANGITKPIKLVPHTFDMEEYKKKYDRLNLPVANKFTFYFIGEFNRRKHLSALIKAFHTEFSVEEPVELVLKVNKYGTNPEQLGNEIKSFCNSIKDGLKLYKDPSRYKPEIIITVDISREDILRLHSTCDCFVAPSYGEAWCIPAWEAMAMGNIVIASATGGMLDYIDSERNGFLVGGSMEPVFGQMDTFEEFGTAREKWFDISTQSLMKTMRRVYELPKNRKAEIGCEAHMSSFKYGYEPIGNLMKGLLDV
jgi:glycosyltransferase involved in cell wall biosynthesis